MDQRLNELTAWVYGHLVVMGLAVPEDAALTAVSGDASFRRYFRAVAGERSFIVMDAPPEKESCEAFIHVAQGLEAQGLTVPHLFAIDRSRGFLLLSDLGDELYLSHLNAATVDALYEEALNALLRIQGCDVLATTLPLYDATLLRNEMQLFTEWFCNRLLGVCFDAQEVACVEAVFEHMIDNALAQPQVCVHRDYHSRNLMCVAKSGPGILDFQDAVKGAITYDLVSLLKDCYIAWPREQVEQWALLFAQKLRDQKKITADDATFLQWFDWMGLQRHLKVLGIFARLNLRDHKPRYLHDIPLVFDYVLDVTARYAQFSDFHRWLKNTIYPMWEHAYKAIQANT